MDATASVCEDAGMQRGFTTIAIMGLLLACTADDVPADTAGSTTHPGGSESDETATTGEPGSSCGDGIVDLGEDCDDGNELDGDGCTAVCELGPCAWEWARRDPAMTSEDGNWLIVSPMALDADGAWLAHQIDPDGERGTRLLHAGADGSPLATHDLDLTPGDDNIYGVAHEPSGDVFVAHTRFDIQTAEIRRMQPDGTEVWMHSHDSVAHVAGLELAANGDLIFVTSTEVSSIDTDALIVALDPTDGNERWTQTHGGAGAFNGYSEDHGAGLALDEEGRRFVAVHEYTDVGLAIPVVVAYAPGDSGEPLWVSHTVDEPISALQIFAIAVGQGGTVAVGYKTLLGPFTIVALDAATGTVQWDFGLHDLEGSFEWSIIRGLALHGDRLMAVGSWATDIESARQGYALGLNLDGTLACLTTLDGVDLGIPGASVSPAALVSSATGFRVSGFVSSVDGTQIDLLQGHIR
jgi:cysteine-rich repeat protein